MINEKEGLEETVAGFASRCAASLRHQESLCSVVTVFVATNRYRDDLAQYRNKATCKLGKPSSDTSVIIKAATALLDTLYRQGYMYKQAGVVLSGIEPDEGHQLDLFSVENDERRQRLMSVADSINHKFGPDSITFGKH